jgi:hypothetical protein
MPLEQPPRARLSSGADDSRGLKHMTTPIFISKYRNAAHTIRDGLEHRDLPGWMSDRDIGPGENFQTSIVEAIPCRQINR